jgi:hypothetical protein
MLLGVGGKFSFRDAVLDDNGLTNGNWHAHIQLSGCLCGQDGTLGKKAELMDPIHCQRRKLPNLAEWVRPLWQDLANAALRGAGRSEQIDHRTLEAQGVDREPTVHLGPSAAGLERRTGRRSRRREFHEEVKAAGRAQRREIAHCRKELAELDAEIAQLQQAILRLRGEAMLADFRAQIDERRRLEAEAAQARLADLERRREAAERLLSQQQARQDAELRAVRQRQERAQAELERLDREAAELPDEPAIFGDRASEPLSQPSHYEVKRGRYGMLYIRRPADCLAMVDSGRRIKVKELDPKTLRAALELAAAKWSTFELLGSAEFKAAVVREAVALGVADLIRNPELRTLVAMRQVQHASGLTPPLTKPGAPTAILAPRKRL